MVTKRNLMKTYFEKKSFRGSDRQPDSGKDLLHYLFRKKLNQSTSCASERYSINQSCCNYIYSERHLINQPVVLLLHYLFRKALNQPVVLLLHFLFRKTFNQSINQSCCFYITCLEWHSINQPVVLLLHFLLRKAINQSVMLLLHYFFRKAFNQSVVLLHH